MLLDIIKEDLAENFREGDEDILQEIIDRVTANALSISNRVNNEKNIELLTNEIQECVKGLYLLRGAEGSKSLNDTGVSTTFTNPIEQMRLEIVKSGKRVPYL